MKKVQIPIKLSFPIENPQRGLMLRILIHGIPCLYQMVIDSINNTYHLELIEVCEETQQTQS